MRLTTEELRFDIQQELAIVLFSEVSRQELGSTQNPILWVLGAVSPG
jgi:hypothetical protein